MENKGPERFSFNQSIALSEEQQKIIYSDIREDQRIQACAGSGKTTTLIYRIEYLIKQGIPADQIILTTFNVEGANDLQIKAKQILSQGKNEVLITNFDKFTAKIYNKFLNESDKLNHFKPEVKQISCKAKDFLETKDGEQKVLKKYQYLFFDEFQDVNQIQYDIIILFKEAGCKIIVVGDEAQNIYSFRGSKIEFMKVNIVEDVQSIKTYQLTKNFRSSSKIIQFCNQILASQMESLIVDEMKSKPKITFYDNLDQQVNDIIQQLIDLQEKEKFQWSDMAILSPTTKEITHFQEILEKNNSTINKKKIPYCKGFGNEDYFSVLSTHKDTEQRKNLTLSTIHGCKGLEWKVVFMIGINDNNFPGEKAEKNKDNLSEKRREFYVACTRAREQLNFCFIEKGEKEKEKICRFISEIDEKYYQKVKSNFNLESAKNQYNLKLYSRPYSEIKKIIDNYKSRDYQAMDSFLQQIKYDYEEKKKEYAILTYDQKNEISLYQDLICYLKILLYRHIAEKFLESEIQNVDPINRLNGLGHFQEKQKYIDSNEKFYDQRYQTEQILEDVYNVSKCCLISQGITRQLYRNDFEWLQLWNVGSNISSFLEVLEKNYDRFEINKEVENRQLKEFIDLLAFQKPQNEQKKCDIIQFKCYYGESPMKISKFEIIKSLFCASMLKRQNYSIQNIKFYNVLKEDWITFPIDQWNQEKEFFEFLIFKRQKVQKESQDTNNNLKKEDQQKVKIEENNLQSQSLFIEEQEQEQEEEEEKVNDSKNFNNYNLQELQQVQKNQIIYQLNYGNSQYSTQYQSQISDQLICGNQGEYNDNLTQIATGDLKINQNDPFENQNTLITNSQLIRDYSIKIEEDHQQQMNLNNHVDDNSQALVNNNKNELRSANEMSNLNQKRMRDKNQVEEEEQEKIIFKKLKVESGETTTI